MMRTFKPILSAAEEALEARTKPQPAPRHPDALLLALGEEMRARHADRVYLDARCRRGEQVAPAEVDRICDGGHEVAKLIEAVEPSTMEGVMVKAFAVGASRNFDPFIRGDDYPDATTDLRLSLQVLNALMTMVRP